MSVYKWRYTVAQTFENICNDQPPWIAIGNFLNDWETYAVEHRRELIEVPLASASTPTLLRWAAFCAAMVDWLCWQADIEAPAWVNQECYTLKDPWFYYEDEASRSWLLAMTPAPFKMRNIFIGDRAFLTKKDAPTFVQHRRNAS